MGWARWCAGVAGVSLVGSALVGSTVAYAVGPTQVSIEGRVLRVVSPAGQEDSVSLRPLGQTWVDVVSTGALQATAPCTQEAIDRVRCAVAGFDSYLVDTGDRADQVGITTTVPGSIRTGSGDDLVFDGPGSADIDLGPGNDEIRPDIRTPEQATGPDTVAGGSGVDTLTYGGSPASVTVWLDDHPNDGLVGNENDNFRSDIENIIGSIGHDLLSGTAADNVITGLMGSDTIDARGGNDVVLEGWAAVGLPGNSGADRIFGDTGVDVVSYAQRSIGVTVTSDARPDDGQPGEQDNVHTDVEYIVGGLGNDKLVGNSRNNLLNGLGGNDILSGAEGNDLLVGGSGADQLLGGAGADAASYQSHTKGVGATLDGRANDGAPGEGDNVRLDVENLIGGHGHDTLIGNNIANVLNGMAGNDRLFGRPGNDVLVGGAGTDSAFGESGRDSCQTESRSSCP